MNATEFQQRIRTEGRYETPAKGRLRLPSWLAMPFGYLGMAQVYLSGNLDARFHRDFEQNYFAKFGMMPFRMMESFGTQIRYCGFERVREMDMPVVWVANHMSPLETYILPPALLAFSPLAIVLKESLVHYPVFGRVVRSIHTIRLGRKNAMADLRTTLEQGEQLLKEGRSVLVFPEGSRSRTFYPEAFNSIGVKLAQRAKVPVVPVALRTDAMQIGRKMKDLFIIHPERPVRIECGPPVLPGADPRAALAELRDFISGRLAEWQTEYDSGVPLLPPPSSQKP